MKTKYSNFSKGENNAMSLDIGRKVKAYSNFDPRYSLASHTSWCTMWERFGLGGEIWKKGEREKRQFV